MPEKIISLCFTCKNWFEEDALVSVKVPDQAGYITKKICKECEEGITNRSNIKIGSAKPKKLLMEDKG